MISPPLFVARRIQRPWVGSRYPYFRRCTDFSSLGSCKQIVVADRDSARTEWPALSASFTVSRPIPLLAPIIRTVFIGSKLPDQPARRSGLEAGGGAFLVCGAEIVVCELNRRSETACSGYPWLSVWGQARSTAKRLRPASEQWSSAASWVARKTTRGAWPASSASCQRGAHRHQRSPGFRPGKPISNPYATTVGAGPGSLITTVNVETGAGISTVDASAISLSDNATITLLPGSTVQNAGSGGGNYGTGINTIEFRNNTTLIINQGASVISTGPDLNAEPINPQGSGNTIINYGTVQKITAGNAIFFEGTSGLNTVINYGLIQVNSPTAQAVGGTNFGASSAAVDFTNIGTVYGSLGLAEEMTYCVYLRVKRLPGQWTVATALISCF